MRAGNARAAPVVVRAAVELYGEDVAPCTKTVKAAHETHAAKNLSLKTALRDIPAPPARGRRQHFPAEGMSTLRAFVKMLRLAKLPVFRETVIHYARALIADTTWDKNFRNDNGFHSRSKWHHWYYDHFIGDDPSRRQ